NESKIGAESRKLLSINDGGPDNVSGPENATCIGCKDDYNPRPTFSFEALNVESLNAKNLTIHSKMCYEGGNEKDLIMDGQGVKKPVYINTSDISNCSSGSDWVSTTVPSSTVSGNDYYYYECSSCNSSSYYRLMGDNSTSSGYSQFYNGSEYKTLNFDYMVNVSTNSSLTFSWVETPVSKNDVEQGLNVSLTCDTCDADDYYRLMSDASNSGHSYLFNGSKTEKLEEDYMTRVWTNSSLNYSTALTRVNSSDLDENTNITLSCPSCTEGYNVLHSNDNGGSYINNQPFNGEFLIKGEKRPLNTSWTTIKVGKQELRNNNDVSFGCTSCSEDRFYVGLDNFSTLDTEVSTPRRSFTKKSGGMLRIWTNSSLKFDRVRTEVAGEDIAQGENITYFCDNCGEPSYNLMQDSDSSVASYKREATGYESVSSGFMVGAESYGSNRGLEIAASRYPSLVTVLNSSSSEIWNFSTDARPSAVTIGDATGERTGNEVVIGTKAGVTVLDSTGSLYGRYPDEGSPWFRTVAVGDVSGDSSLEIVGGTDSGNLALLNSSLDAVWNISVGSRVKSVETGNLTGFQDKSVVAGLKNGDLIIVSGDGSIVGNYSFSGDIVEVDSGNVAADEGLETAVSTSDTKVFNFFRPPENLSVDVGNDGSLEWSQSDVFTGNTTVQGSGFVSAFNNELGSCTSSLCNISVRFDSNSGGEVRVSRPELDFDYYLSDTVDSDTGVVKWRKSSNIDVGESLMYESLKVMYSSPAIHVGTEYIISQDINNALGSQSSPLIGFNNYSFTESGNLISLPEYLDFMRFPGTSPRSSDYIWYNNSKSEAPVEMVESGLSTGSPTYKNITIYRASDRTDTVFTNVTANLDFDDSQISGDTFVKVDWDEDGSFTEITPGTSCPSLEKQSAEGETFYTCRKDTDGNGKYDRFKTVHPRVTSSAPYNSTTYRVGGVSNFAPTIVSQKASPETGKWGEEFNFTAEFDDPENDQVNATLWINTENGWQKQGTKTVSDTSKFQLSSTKQWTGLTDYMFEYQDVNSNLNALHPAENSTSNNIEVLKHDLDVEYINGGGLNIDRKGETWTPSVRLLDNSTGNPVSSSVTCNLRLSGAIQELKLPNSSGYCNFDVSGLDLPVGSHNWDVKADESSYHLSGVSPTKSVTLIGDISVGSKELSETVFRPDSHVNSSFNYNYSGITDEFGDSISPDYELDIEGVGTYTGSDVSPPITGSINFADNAALGQRDVNMTLSDQFFSTNTLLDSFNLKGVLKTDLYSKDLVYTTEDTANLTVHIEDSAGFSRDAQVSFEIPQGVCLEEYHPATGNYTCEFDPTDSLDAGSYNWSVDLSKTNYVYEEDDKKNLEVHSNIQADISTTESPVNRFDNSEERTTVWTNISNIKTSSGNNIDNVNYEVIWNGSVKASGQVSNSVDQSFDVPDTETLNKTVLEVKLEKGKYRPFQLRENLTVKGEINASLSQEKDTVYAENDAVNLTADLENMLGTPLNADVQFETPSGYCEEKFSQTGQVTCRYNPADSLSPGQKTWWIEASNQLYSYSENESKSLDIGGGLTASTSASDTVYRYNGSSKNKEITYSVSDIESGGSDIDSVDYTVYWRGSAIDNGVTDSTGFTNSYNVPDSS
ncbi:MAG: hypothetical protein ABEJ93_00175, partial [Candidatus Nanohalobium sp.]